MSSLLSAADRGKTDFSPRWECVPVRVVRTAMCGGGTSYDVYVPIRCKEYKPIAGNCYATEIWWNGGRYYRLSDFFRTPRLDKLPARTEERWNAYKRLEKLTDRLEAVLAARAFPELAGARKLPGLWASWNLPSAETTVSLRVRCDRDGNGGAA